MTKIILITFLLLAGGQIHAQSARSISYRQQCLEIKKYLVQNQYQLDCNYSYHHYNANSSRLYYTGDNAKVRIGSFNLFNPGSSQTYYKDYALIAKTIDQFDVVAAIELLPVVGEDLDNNEAVLQFIANAPQITRDLKKTAPAQLSRLAADLEIAPTLYRPPGYLKILDELRRLDPSWSLLLTPRGQGSAVSNVQELAGYYYRARNVKTTQNEYCKEFVTNNIGSPVACIPNLGAAFLGKDLRPVFSRRPFIASFESGNFQFTLLATHVIFTSPIDQTSMENILGPTFGVSNYHQLGTGVTKQNYARFAEIQATLFFMRKLRERYPWQRLILMGDLNIESSNIFWEQLLTRNSGYQLFITQPTSTTKLRYNRDGTPTYGYASNYDHFIYNPKETTECKDATRYDFYRRSIAKEVNSRYLVRAEKKAGKSYPIIAQYKIDRAIELMKQRLKSRFTIKYNQVVWDDYKYSYRLSSFKKRVFTDQQYDQTYYRLFSEILSDHAPISLSCTTN